MVSGALTLLAVLMIIFRNFSEPLAAQIVNAVLWATPAGWIYLGCRQALLGAAWAALLPAIPVALMVATIPSSRTRLRSVFATKEMDFRMSGDESDEEREAYGAMEAERTGGLDARHRILRRKFLELPQLEAGEFADCFALRWLSSREYVVAQFMSGGGMGWTGMWKKAAIITAVGLVGMLLPGAWGVGLIVGAGAVAAMFAAPLFGGQWAGFGFWGGSVTACSLVPVGFWEVCRVMMKINFARCLLWLPLLAVSCEAFVWKNGMNPASGLNMALRLCLIVALLQPLYVIYKCSQCSNDTTMAKWRMLGVGAWALLAAAGAVVLMIGTLNAEAGSLPTTLFSLAVAVVGSMGALCVYGNSFNRNRFDLMPAPR
jgi:hypothetical protein